MRKKLKIFVIVTLAAFTVICLLVVNAYLVENNLFIYASGTNDKAFLNSTWKMSPSEIERANNTSLSNSEMLLLFTPEVTNQDRFKSLVQKNVFLWGHSAKVEYTFFDNMLYEYYIILTAYDRDKPHKEILETLREQFGKEKEGKKGRPDVIYSFNWETDKQTVSYWMGENEEKKDYYIGIRAMYKPFYNEIIDIAKSEKRKYF